MDRGGWPATVHGVTKSGTQLSDWACMHAWSILERYLYALKNIIRLYSYWLEWAKASVSSKLFILMCTSVSMLILLSCCIYWQNWDFEIFHYSCPFIFWFFLVLFNKFCLFTYPTLFVRLLYYFPMVQIRSDQSLSRVRLFTTPWIAACQASLSITNSRSSHGYCNKLPEI